MNKVQEAQKSKKKGKGEDWEEKAQEYLNGWKRAQADFINYKKDEARRVEDIVKFANESLLLEAIEVLDNLEKALAETPKSLNKECTDWLEGIEQTRKQFKDFLAKHNVEQIKVKGVKFDPLLHEAVGGADTDYSHNGGPHSKEKGTMKEVRAGYKMYGKVIRPARVIITK